MLRYCSMRLIPCHLPWAEVQRMGSSVPRGALYPPSWWGINSRKNERETEGAFCSTYLQRSEWDHIALDMAPRRYHTTEHFPWLVPRASIRLLSSSYIKSVYESLTRSGFVWLVMIFLFFLLSNSSHMERDIK